MRHEAIASLVALTFANPPFETGHKPFLDLCKEAARQSSGTTADQIDAEFRVWFEALMVCLKEGSIPNVFPESDPLRDTWILTIGGPRLPGLLTIRDAGVLLRVCPNGLRRRWRSKLVTSPSHLHRGKELLLVRKLMVLDVIRANLKGRNR